MGTTQPILLTTKWWLHYKDRTLGRHTGRRSEKDRKRVDPARSKRRILSTSTAVKIGIFSYTWMICNVFWNQKNLIFPLGAWVIAHEEPVPVRMSHGGRGSSNSKGALYQTPPTVFTPSAEE